MTTDRVDHTATVIPSGPKSGWILLAAGDTTDRYDPLANTFAARPRPTLPRGSHTATVIPLGRNAGKILLAGGW